MRYLNLPSIVGIAMLMALSAFAKEGQIMVFDEVQSIHFPDGLFIFDNDGRFRKQSNPAQNANVKAYVDVDGKRRYFSDWSWDKYVADGTPPNYILARPPKGSSQSREYVAETKTLNFEVKQDMEPDPPKETTKVRRRDFDRLPDYGKNIGPRWDQRWPETQGRVAEHTASIYGEAGLFYDWGTLKVHWLGAEHPPAKWETGGKVMGNWGPTMDPGVTHLSTQKSGQKLIYEIHHPTKHIVLKNWGPESTDPKIVTPEQMEVLAKQYFELLEPYAQPRKYPIERQEGAVAPMNTPTFSSSATDDLDLTTPKPPILGQP